MCQGLSTGNCPFEPVAQQRIWIEPGTFGKSRVVLIELRFQYAEPVEFGEQITCSFAHRTDRIFRMLLFPQRELVLSTGKVKVIESSESAIERARGGRYREIFGFRAPNEAREQDCHYRAPSCIYKFVHVPGSQSLVYYL